MEGLDFERGQTGWVFMWKRYVLLKMKESEEGPFLPVPFIFVYKTASNPVEFLTKVNIVNHVGRFFASLILRPHLNGLC